MVGLTWLHLSDWHQKGEDFNRTVVRDALIKDISQRKDRISPALESIDFIIFSGDVAFSGKESEYKSAVQYLFDPVIKAANLENDHLFIVPGNHDLNRNAFELLPQTILQPLTSEEDIHQWLTNEQKRNRLLEPFEAYNQFIKPYAKGNLSNYSSSYSLDIDTKTIAILGFNSAFMSGRNKDNTQGQIDDYGKLIIGEPQIYQALENISKADIRIAVMHHPFAWIMETDRNRTEDRLRKGVHFILCGHQHVSQVEIVTGTQGDCIIIPAGTSYDRRIPQNPRYTNAYNFVHLDFEKNQGAAYLRCWSDRNGEWRKDVDAHPEGEFEFPLPAGLVSGPIGTIPKVGKQGQIIAVNADESSASVSTRRESAVTAPLPPGQKYNLQNVVFNIQYREKGEGVVGRAEILESLHQQLTAGMNTAIGHTAAFHGLGGLGKTQLAVEYAYRYRHEYPKGVIWINADQDIDAQLIRIARDACWVSSQSEHSVILELAKRRIQTYSECLIIFDNVEDQKIIEPYFPLPEAKPHLLVTSRVPQKGFTTIELPLLDEDLSLLMLLKESQRENDTLPDEEQEAAGEIVRSLDGLPLAIEIAGAYLSHLPNCSFQKYRSILQAHWKTAMAGEMLSSFTKHEQNLYLTLQVSEPVLRTAPLLQDILDLLAWSGSSFMGLSLMSAMLKVKETDLYHPLTLGTELHLLNKEPEGERYAIHRLVGHVRREQAPIAERKEWIIEVCQRLGDWFEKQRQDFTSLPAFEAEIDHLTQWLGHVKSDSGQASRLIWLQAYPPYHWGKYQEAQLFIQSALSLMADDPNANPELKAHIFNDLSFITNALGQSSKALEYAKQSLEIRQQLFGEQHPDTAFSLNNIGSAYASLGKPAEALKYHDRAFQIQHQLFGEQHPDTALSLNNIGIAYVYLEKPAEALKYFERAFHIRHQLFGEQHPDTAASLNNIGAAYGKLKKFSEALTYHEDALYILQKLFGEQHPYIATTISNIGYIYENMGNRKGTLALKYYKQALYIRNKVLGKQHPNTISSLKKVASCLLKLRKFQEAFNHLNRFLPNLSPIHPKYIELLSLKRHIDKESLKHGFRPPLRRSSPKSKKKKC